MDNFCIIVNKDRDEQLELAKQVQDFLEKRGKKYCTYVESLNTGETVISEISDDVECAIVLGGDGTLIRAAKRLLKRDVLLFGINAGTLGYLACVEASEAEKGLEALCNGEYHTESRMMLKAEVNGQYEDTVLNEVAINRSGVCRLISLAVYINGALLDVIAGDGLLISTPTGSTGYNLSAGGAIVKPETRLIMITPLCPHSLTSRGVIVSAEDEILIEVKQGNRTQDVEALVTFDGRIAKNLKAGDKVVINCSSYTTKMVRLEDGNFFEVLRSKLGSVER